MNQPAEFFRETFNLTVDNQLKILYSVLIILILWLIRFVILKLVWRNTDDEIDIRLFQFTVLENGNRVDADQSTGRIIHTPSGKEHQIWERVLKEFQKYEDIQFAYPTQRSVTGTGREIKSDLQTVFNQKDKST